MILDVFWIFLFAKIARVWPKSGKCQATLVQCYPQTDSGSANADDRTGTNHAESQKIRFLEFVNIGRRSADVLFTSVEALLRCTAQDFKNSVVEILSSAP